MSVPEDLDREELDRILADPETWDENELQRVRSLRRQALDRLHEMVFGEPPADDMHVERVESVIDDYEEALSRYEATHS